MTGFRPASEGLRNDLVLEGMVDVDILDVCCFIVSQGKTGQRVGLAKARLLQVSSGVRAQGYNFYSHLELPGAFVFSLPRSMPQINQYDVHRYYYSYSCSIAMDPSTA